MNLLKSLSISTCTVLTLLCSSEIRAEEVIRLSMGTTPMANIFSKIQEPFEKTTGIKIVYVQKDPKGHGSDLVFKDVDSGSAEGGAGGTSWQNWLEIIADKKIQAMHMDEIKTRVIGRDRIQILTYTKGPTKLSEQEIKDIFLGQVTNFKQIGGEDKNVVIFLSPKQVATQAFFESTFLHAKISSKNVKFLEDTQSIHEMAKVIAETPGAIGFGPMNAISNAVNVPKHQIIGRPITFIFRSKGRAPDKIEKLLAFIKDHGKEHGLLD